MDCGRTGLIASCKQDDLATASMICFIKCKQMKPRQLPIRPTVMYCNVDGTKRHSLTPCSMYIIGGYLAAGIQLIPFSCCSCGWFCNTLEIEVNS